jgi:pimeloyl-ACP methyl ester carboxylesterase
VTVAAQDGLSGLTAGSLRLAGMGEYSTVTSRDGTSVSVLSTGSGPGLVVVPGNNRRAHHYENLAAELPERTVHIVERRGRGGTGPQGTVYTVDSEAGDVLAVIEHTGVEEVFGHSYGGLISLHVALRRRLRSLVVYEPGVSIGGSFVGDYLPTLRRELAQGRQVAAMTTFLKGSGISPFPSAPRFVHRGLAYLLLQGAGGREMRDMMPSTPAELAEVLRLDSDGARYAGVQAPTLLLAGTKSPPYFRSVLPRLAAVIPGARYEILEGLDHNAPDLNAPALIAARLRRHLHSGRSGFPERD